MIKELEAREWLAKAKEIIEARDDAWRDSMQISDYYTNYRPLLAAEHKLLDEYDKSSCFGVQLLGRKLTPWQQELLDVLGLLRSRRHQDSPKIL